LAVKYERWGTVDESNLYVSYEKKCRVQELFGEIKGLLQGNQIHLLIEYDVIKNAIAVSEIEEAYNKGLKDGIRVRD
jgi:hypothetical protein